MRIPCNAKLHRIRLQINGTQIEINRFRYSNASRTVCTLVHATISFSQYNPPHLGGWIHTYSQTINFRLIHLVIYPSNWRMRFYFVPHDIPAWKRLKHLFLRRLYVVRSYTMFYENATTYIIKHEYGYRSVSALYMFGGRWESECVLLFNVHSGNFHK